MNELLHIFAYLKKKPKLTIYMNPQQPMISINTFKVDPTSFHEMYRDATEELPFNAPIPRGQSVMMTAFVDSSHGSNKVTRRSHTGYIIFVNRAPIIWYSKRQNTVEASTFSSEFIALKVCVEAIVGLRFKLRMFGIEVDGPAGIFCDNESVVKNTSNVESTLHKKHSAIAYHYVRWCVTASIIVIAWISTDENLADAFAKRLSEPTRDYLFGSWTY